MAGRTHVGAIAAIIAAIGLFGTAAGAAATQDLSGSWTYYAAQGQSQITQSGDHVSIALTWTPNSEPGPHYLVDATLHGQMLNGVWRCKATACHHQTGKFHAQLSSDASQIKVSRTQDPGNANRWNGLVLVRSTTMGR